MLLALVGTALLGSLPAHALGQTSGGSVASRVGFDQKLDARIPLDIPLRDEAGKPVRLGEFFGEKPVILTLVYYECPMLCNEVLNALTRGLKGLKSDVGDRFEVVTVSIDPTETPALAARKKSGYLRRYGRAGAGRGWHFLTGDEASIGKLARSVGFRYVYMPESKQYAHAAGIVLLTPAGKVARYFFGISYAPRDLRLGLAEASSGTISSPIDQMLLFCYRFDSSSGKYTFAVINAIRVFATITALTLAAYVATMLRRERKGAGGAAPRIDGPRALPTTP
ncbi:MAG: SCO family protein [Singulisphaera sp.]